MRLLPALLLLLPFALRAQAVAPWELEPSETTADLRGVHAAGGGVVWASGTNGTVLRSQDSGFEWQGCAVPPGAEKLDFRAVWAWDDQTALVMSSGPGPLSRLYRTVDGCAHWVLLSTNADKDGFWDGLAFYDRKHGFLVGDPVGGKLVLLGTADGGLTWKPVPSNDLDVGTRGLFAASNSFLSLGVASGPKTDGPGYLPWIGTSGTSGTSGHVGPLVLAGYLDLAGMSKPLAANLQHYGFSHDPVPVAGGTATAGVFSLVYRNNSEGIANAVAVGGDYAQPNQSAGTAAWWSASSDKWLPSTKLPGGYRSAVAWNAEHKLWVAVGPNGSDLSRDDGRTWTELEHAPSNVPKGGEWNALSLPWAVGPHGRIGKLNPEALPK